MHIRARLAAIILTSLAPNSIVVRIDRKEKLMLYHQALATSLPEVAKDLGARP